MTDIASLKLKIDASEAKTAQSDLENLSKEAKETEKEMTTMGRNVGFAFTAAATALIAFTKSSINSADAMNDMRIRTGLALDQLAAYDLLARQSGTDLDSMAKGFKNLGNYMIEHRDKLIKIGVTSSDQSVAMGQFADVIAGIKDPVLRAALATEVLKRSGIELLPVLTQGSEAILGARQETADYAAVLERIAPQADQFNDSLEVMWTRAKEAGASLAEYFLPALNEIASTFLETQKNSGSLIATIEAIGVAALKTIGIETDEVKIVQKEVNELFKEAFDLKNKIAEEKGHDYPDTGLIKNLEKRRNAILADIQIQNEWLAQQAKTKQSVASLTEGQLGAVKSIVEPTDTEAEKAARKYSAALRERNSILENTSPQEKANQSWMKIITLQGKLRDEHKLTDDQMRRAYEVMTGDEALKQREKDLREFNDAMKESLKILGEVDIQERSIQEWQKLLDLQEKLGDQFPLTMDQMKKYHADTMDSIRDKSKDGFVTMSEFAKQAGRNMQNVFADFLFDPMKDGFDGMIRNFGVMLQRMAAQAAAANILQSIGAWGATGGGMGTFWGGAAAAMFGPAKTGTAARAEGGSVSAGGSYMVGERGPELFTPASNGKIDPNKSSKRLSVVNNFILSSPPDRRTQEQMATMAGMSVNRAMARSM